MVKPVKFTRDSGCPARDEFLVINVVHILAVIPATACSAERSFSALRRLRTYLRNTMQLTVGQQRVSNVHRTYYTVTLKGQMPTLLTCFMIDSFVRIFSLRK